MYQRSATPRGQPADASIALVPSFYAVAIGYEEGTVGDSEAKASSASVSCCFAVAPAAVVTGVTAL
eukprot:COSAG02_NODE_50665_length_319_cov_0.700000_1_plen_65_part_10